MFNSPFFETLISLVFILLIFSIIVSCVQEGYVAIFKLRGKMLQYAIQEMLKDPANKNFANLLYQHPQIDLLRQKPDDLPSYISAQNFSSALIDLIAGESVQMQTQTQAGGTTPITTEVWNPALQNSVAAASITASSPVIAPLVDKFKAGVETLAQSDLKKLLKSFATVATQVRANVLTAESDLETLRKNIENWYNSYMQRVTGWYKRKVRSNIFFASLVVTLFFNLNFITVTKTVYADSNLRTTITAMATQAAKNDSTITTLTDKLKNDSATLGDIKPEALIGVKLPIGWTKLQLPPEDQKSNWFANTWAKIVYFCKTEISWRAVLGWAMFIGLLSLGAPFWFDILKKLVNIRNSGQSPAESKT